MFTITVITKITKVEIVSDLCLSPKINNTKERVNNNILLAKAKVKMLVGLGHLGRQQIPRSRIRKTGNLTIPKSWERAKFVRYISFKRVHVFNFY